MAKNPVAAPGSPLATYPLRSGGWQSYPIERRIVEVGRLDALHAAVDTAQAGDIILISWPGTYRLQRTLVPAAANVAIMGDTNDPTEIILEGPGMDNASYGARSNGIYSEYAELTVANLTIQKFYLHGITFGAGATDPTIDNVRLLDIGQQFLKVSAFPEAINNGLVTRSRFAYTAGRPATDHAGAGYFYGGLIDVHNSSGWRVSDCEFEENTPTAEEIAAVPGGATKHLWSPAVYFWNRSTAPIVERCTFKNCVRAVSLGLELRSGGEHDCYGGVVRNNMISVEPGRFNTETVEGSDGAINIWDCPGGAAINNTIYAADGQIANSVQGRWPSNLTVDGNLSNLSVRSRDTAVLTGVNNVQNASAAWFVNPATGDLRLNSTGNANVGTTPRSNDCLDDFDGAVRPASTKIGAHQYG